MTDLSHAVVGDLVEDATVFFAPVSSDLVDSLIGAYQSERQRIEQLHEMMTGGGFSGALFHFMEGNSTDQGRYYTTDIANLMQLAPAIASLNASYWGKALSLTDVYDSMPQKRRDEWNAQIRQPMGKKAQRRYLKDGKDDTVEWEIHPLPDFEEQSVRSTLSNLLLARSKFFAERVDGIFRSLSGLHITNTPSGFGIRMIVGDMLTSYDTVNYERAGYLNDLRCVIAKFMGREEPRHGDTGPLLEIFRRRTGAWHEVDGGTIRMKMFKKGTCHIQVHEDMAWRLNAILASLYPTAIPASFRTKPKARGKHHKLFGRPLPFTVVNMLHAMRPEPNTPTRIDRWSEPRPAVTECPWALRFDYSVRNSVVQAEAEKVLTMIGGVRRNVNAHVWFDFDYNARPVIEEIVLTGCIPDVKAHQFYPTPSELSVQAVQMAGIEEHHSCLEPEAGTGGLAKHLPKDRTRCIEISELHCKVLHAKGFDVTCADFIAWSDTTCERFDRVVMNPPYSDGRWQSHTLAAGRLVKPDGCLVAILPASAKGKDLLPGFDHEWSTVIENAFAGTSVSVVMLKATKQ